MRRHRRVNDTNSLYIKDLRKKKKKYILLFHHTLVRIVLSSQLSLRSFYASFPDIGVFLGTYAPPHFYLHPPTLSHPYCIKFATLYLPVHTL